MLRSIRYCKDCSLFTLLWKNSDHTGKCLRYQSTVIPNNLACSWRNYVADENLIADYLKLEEAQCRKLRQER